MTNSFKSIAEKMLDDYKKIPRDMEPKESLDKPEEKSKEELAVQDMREFLDYMDKKITGKLTEQDKRQIRYKIDQWEKSIKILRDAFIV
ncbi:hypothetical protein H6A65_16425 [Mediterraneibacter glycyrrhizinilyticus]|uniref:hypothetical protein n=1 Tax=Mediterraneibacter glycyrrhizinilyticus TaxID=342942 RepID=UPI0019603719|nr:hypothetical protein [Mediterraneibacter glycyrrhizinilyticus]MBM6753047.1 hypothetical protein [Mediterraneibacter glycyrrhizinilyticus]